MFRLARLARCTAPSSTAATRWTATALSTSNTTTLEAPTLGKDSPSDVAAALQALFMSKRTGNSVTITAAIADAPSLDAALAPKSEEEETTTAGKQQQQQSQHPQHPLFAFECLKGLVNFALKSQQQQNPATLQLHCLTMIALRDFYSHKLAAAAAATTTTTTGNESRLAARHQSTQAKNWMQQLAASVSRRVDGAEWHELVPVVIALSEARGDVLMRPVALAASRRMARVAAVAPFSIEKKKEGTAATEDKSNKNDESSSKDNNLVERVPPPPPLDVVAILAESTVDAPVCDPVALLRVVCAWCEALKLGYTEAMQLAAIDQQQQKQQQSAESQGDDDLLDRIFSKSPILQMILTPSQGSSGNNNNNASKRSDAFETILSFLRERAHELAAASRTEHNKEAMQAIMERLGKCRRFAVEFLAREQVRTMDVKHCAQSWTAAELVRNFHRALQQLKSVAGAAPPVAAEDSNKKETAELAQQLQQENERALRDAAAQQVTELARIVARRVNDLSPEQLQSAASAVLRIKHSGPGPSSSLTVFPYSERVAVVRACWKALTTMTTTTTSSSERNEATTTTTTSMLSELILLRNTATLMGRLLAFDLRRIAALNAGKDDDYSSSSLTTAEDDFFLLRGGTALQEEGRAEAVKTLAALSARLLVIESEREKLKQSVTADKLQAEEALQLQVDKTKREAAAAAAAVATTSETTEPTATVDAEQQPQQQPKGDAPKDDTDTTNAAATKQQPAAPPRQRIPPYSLSLTTQLRLVACMSQLGIVDEALSRVQKKKQPTQEQQQSAEQDRAEATTTSTDVFTRVLELVLNSSVAQITTTNDLIDFFSLALRLYPIDPVRIPPLLDACTNCFANIAQKQQQQQQNSGRSSSVGDSAGGSSISSLLRLLQQDLDQQQSSASSPPRFAVPELLPRINNFLTVALHRSSSNSNNSNNSQQHSGSPSPSPADILAAARLIRRANGTSDFLAKQVLLYLARRGGKSSGALSLKERLELMHLVCSISSPATNALTSASLLLICKDIPGLFSATSWDEFEQQKQKQQQQEAPQQAEPDEQEQQGDLEIVDETTAAVATTATAAAVTTAVVEDAAVVVTPQQMLTVYIMAQRCGATSVVEKMAEAELMRDVPATLPDAAEATTSTTTSAADAAHDNDLLSSAVVRWALRALLLCDAAGLASTRVSSAALARINADDGAAEALPGMHALLKLSQVNNEMRDLVAGCATKLLVRIGTRIVAAQEQQKQPMPRAHQEHNDNGKSELEEDDDDDADDRDIDGPNLVIDHEQQQKQQLKEREQEEDSGNSNNSNSNEEHETQDAADDEQEVKATTTAAIATKTAAIREEQLLMIISAFVELCTLVFMHSDASLTPQKQADAARLLRIAVSLQQQSQGEVSATASASFETACVRAFRQLSEQSQGEVLMQCCGASEPTPLASRLVAECGGEAAGKIPLAAAVLLLSVERIAGGGSASSSSSISSVVTERLQRQHVPINTLLPFAGKLDSVTLTAVLDAHFRAVNDGGTRALSLSQGLALLHSAGEKMTAAHRSAIREHLMSLPINKTVASAASQTISNSNNSSGAADDDGGVTAAAEAGAALMRIQGTSALSPEEKMMLSCRVLGFDGHIESVAQLITFIDAQRGQQQQQLQRLTPIVQFVHSQAKRLVFNDLKQQQEQAGAATTSEAGGAPTLSRPLIRALSRTDLLTQEFVDDVCASRLVEILSNSSTDITAQESAATDLLFLFRCAADKKLLDRAHLERLVKIIHAQEDHWNGQTATTIFDPQELIEFIDLQYNASSRNPQVIQQTLPPLCDAAQRMIVRQQKNPQTSNTARNNNTQQQQQHEQPQASSSSTSAAVDTNGHQLLRTITTIQKCGSALMPELRDQVRRYCARIVHSVEPSALATMVRVVTADPLLADQALGILTARLERVAPLLSPEDWLPIAQTLASSSSWCDAARVELLVELLSQQYLRFAAAPGSATTNKRVLASTHVTVLELLARFGVNDEEVIRVATTAVRGVLRDLEYARLLALLESFSKLFVDASCDDIIYAALSVIESSKTPPAWAVVRALRCACDLGVPFNRSLHVLFSKAFEMRQIILQTPDLSETMRRVAAEYDKNVVQQISVAFASKKRASA